MIKVNHNPILSCFVFVDKNHLKSINMIDDEIRDTIDRINLLIHLHIYLARVRLAGLDMKINAYMRMYNGNKKELLVLYQNLPGTLSNFNMIASIQSLLNRRDPDILALAEPSTTDLDVDWDPYILLPGYILRGNRTRLTVLIKKNLKFKATHWNVEIPT